MLNETLNSDATFKFAIALTLVLSVATSLLTIIKYFEDKEVARKKIESARK